MTRRTRVRPLVVAALALLLGVGAAPVAPQAAVASEGCSRAVGPVHYAPGAGRTVALTLDDGPTKFTPQVLRVLRRHDVRATFFVTGRHAAARPRLLRQVVAEGHLVAGHTYDHDYPSQVRGGWTQGYIADQMRRTNRVLSAATGGPICFFRPPGGNQSPGMYAAARASGTAVMLWSVSSEDWAQPATTTAAATQRIVDKAVAGGSQTHPMVLLHDGKGSHEPESQVSSNRSNTVAALPRIIAYYRSRGYRFVDVAGGSGLPPEATRMRVRATPKRVPASTRSVLTGTLGATTGPVARQDVTWLSRPAGSRRWRRGGVVTTTSAGAFELGVRPASDAEYRFVLPGTARYRRASDDVAVSTYTVATDLVVTGPNAVAAGDPVTLQVAVTSDGGPRVGVKVLVSRTVDGVEVTDRLRTDADGAATFTDQPSASTRYTLTVRERLPHESASATHDVEVGPPA